ncbi:protein SIEVE ELEMENT OCCLUSION C-like isoform X2 [Asparagus officinalis]|nr:protein SIEVE ELEMENT OCCLUSION C-like isoform X2 [Asparagus officinalis]
MHSKLLHMFEEAHEDNQKILSTLFAIKNEHPFWDCSSQRKVGVTELRNKEVIFFISHPVIQLEQFLLIVQQLQNHPNNKPENLYEIVWIPIANCIPWSEVEEVSFNNIIDIWPWSSVYKPSLLSFSVLKFIREVWHFHDDPVMVVLDSKGRVISLNAIDMVVIWGDLAYPFSIIRERELWEGESWTFGILLNGIDPLLSYWIEDGRTILLYGSHDIGWVREFTNKVKVIEEAGLSLELIYIGSNNLEQSKEVLATVTTERLSRYLSHIKICIFWLRLESIRKSKSRLGFPFETDVIMREATSLCSLDVENKGFLLISEGARNEILRLSGMEVSECLSLFHVWGQKVNKFGFLGAVRKHLDASPSIDHCSYYSIFPYVENMDERSIACKNCGGPLKKHYLYQCVGS